MLSREGWVAFQCLNCWQQLSSSRGEERAFIPKAKITVKSHSPLALWGCWLRGLHENRCFQKGPPFPSVWKCRPWNPKGILPLAVHDKSSPVWWRTVPEAEARGLQEDIVLWRRLSFFCHLPLPLMTLCWCPQSETDRGSHFTMRSSWCWPLQLQQERLGLNCQVV